MKSLLNRWLLGFFNPWQSVHQAFHRRAPWAPSPGTTLSAILIVLAFPPWDLWPLGLFFLIPILSDLQIRQADWKAALLQGLWMSVITTVGAMYWSAYAIHHFGNLPWALSILMLLLLGLVAEPGFYVYVALRTLFARRLESQHRLLFPLLAALLYAGLDGVLPKIWQDTAGHILHTRPWLRQAADLGGAHLLTFFLVLVNEGIWQGLGELKKGLASPERFSLRLLIHQVTHRAPALWAGGLGLLFLLGYGAVRYDQIRSLDEAADDHYRVGIIQANIGDIDKLTAYQGLRAAAEEMMSTYFNLSDTALKHDPRPDAVVWPETAYPSTFRIPSGTTELIRDLQVEEWVRSRNTTLLFGGYDHSFVLGKDFNTLFFLFPRPYSEVLGKYKDMVVYHKNILLPFGEFIPFADTFTWIKRTFPQVGFFGRGPGPQALPIYRPDGKPKILAHPMICYEALIPSFAIEGVRKGAQFIMNVTNDSWFGPYGEPYHHLAITRFRSIETRRPQLRATNTGISVLITAAGDYEGETGVYTQEISHISIPLPEKPAGTLMLLWGDWFARTALAVSMLSFLGLGLWKRRLAETVTT